MRLVLVRHGDAHAGFHGVIAGPRGCAGLTDRGREQAAARRDFLAVSGRVRADVLCPVDEDDWPDDVDDLAQKVNDGWEPPPVIVSYRDGQLVLEDNQRVEGVRRSGAHHTWAVIGFDDPDERTASAWRDATARETRA
jgi:Histidine phosphatase superfamily (branch 1)